MPPDNPAKVDLARRPRQARRQGRALRPRGALRGGDREGRGVHRGRHQAGQRGAVGHRRARQGRARARPTPGSSTSPTSRAPATRSRASPFPESSSAVNTYPIAALTDSKNADAAPRRSSTSSPAPRARRCCRRRVRQAVSGSRRRRQRAVGAARAGSSSPRWSARCSSCCRWWRCVTRVDWAHFVALITSESSRAALVLSLRTSAASTVLCVRVRRADGAGAGAHRVPRPVACCARWCCCRWCCRRWSAASRCSTRSAGVACSVTPSTCSGCRSRSPPPRS